MSTTRSGKSRLASPLGRGIVQANAPFTVNPSIGKIFDPNLKAIAKFIQIPYARSFGGGTGGGIVSEEFPTVYGDS